MIYYHLLDVESQLLDCEVNWLFNITINDISVIYVTAHRCAGGLKKKLDLWTGSKRHRHFVGFFNVPVQAPTRGHPFYTVIPRNRPILSPFKTRLGYGWHILDLNPMILTGEMLVCTDTLIAVEVLGNRSQYHMLVENSSLSFLNQNTTWNTFYCLSD